MRLRNSSDQRSYLQMPNCRTHSSESPVAGSLVRDFPLLLRSGVLVLLHTASDGYRASRQNLRLAAQQLLRYADLSRSRMFLTMEKTILVVSAHHGAPTWVSHSRRFLRSIRRLLLVQHAIQRSARCVGVVHGFNIVDASVCLASSSMMPTSPSFCSLLARKPTRFHVYAS